METSGKQSSEMYAVVTGSNKGIGLETVRQLASHGITVVLTAVNEKMGMEATSSLRGMGLKNVVFHQLDVADPVSVESLAEFIRKRFGRLDILVNNAAITGAIIDENDLKALKINATSLAPDEVTKMVQGVIKETYEKAEECLNTNFYGVKRVTEALLPLLQKSSSGARIVNVSSLSGELRRISSEHTRNELGNVETLTEEKLDAILTRFLQDFKENAIEANGWSIILPAYSISKAAINAYTRVLARRYPNMYINCVHPGRVKTDLSWHMGIITAEEGAKGPVKCALLPDGGPSGCYFHQTEVAEF